MHYRFSCVLIFSFSFLFSVNVFSQGAPDYLDSLKRRADTTHSLAEKERLLLELSGNILDRGESADYAEQAIELAQESRDERLIATVYLAIGRHFLRNSSLADNLDQADKDFTQVEKIAKDNGMEDLLVQAYCSFSDVWHYRGDDVRALSFCTQALAIASGIDNDSAKLRAYSATGDVYLSMNQMLLALRNYLSELDVAEKNGNYLLMRSADFDLTRFYSVIGETDKALDYATKAYLLDRAHGDMYVAGDLNRLGDLYLQKDQRALAEKMYMHSMAMADSFHFSELRIDAYHRMFLLYVQAHQYKRGLTYLFSQPEMLTALRGAGFSFYIDELMATNYTEQGRYDSAYYYFRRAEPEAVTKWVPENRFEFFTEFGEYFKRTGDLPQAIVYYNKAYVLGASSGQLSMEEKSTDTLEALYEATGNSPAALVCNKRAAIERDSIRSQTQATELMKLEVENEGRRQERLAREAQEQTEHRHNVQYMGLTMGLVVLFVGLVMLARLSVPVWLIRALVFVAFLFLFEFIIMLADKQIQGWTAEEPWRVLLLKIILAAGMVPLHHWLEHKVVLYLSHHKKTPKGAVKSASAPAIES
jgi:hypothetical protein